MKNKSVLNQNRYSLNKFKAFELWTNPNSHKILIHLQWQFFFIVLNKLENFLIKQSFLLFFCWWTLLKQIIFSDFITDFCFIFPFLYLSYLLVKWFSVHKRKWMNWLTMTFPIFSFVFYCSTLNCRQFY